MHDMADMNKPDFQAQPDIDFRQEEETHEIPRFHVVLLDDNEHTYEYVIEMLMKLFGHTAGKAYEMACSVDANGKVVVDTTHKERAEVKRDQIHGYGADWRLSHSSGSMSAVIEPV